MDTNLVEYYQQIGELKKAVRERELHRLELEKQVLQSAQRRERRHEDFKDKIREIQRELAQKEREAAHNFQSLLARVDSIRREHQLLAAQTEQLRQRKLQYEMNLRSADPLLHTAVHQELSGIFKDSEGELWKGHLQANSTPNSKSHLQQPTVPLHHLVSPIPSYNSNYNMTTRPIDPHIPSEATRTKEHHPHGIQVTSPSMLSRSLMEDSLPQMREYSFTQPGDGITTLPTLTMPQHVDCKIPSHDISKERHPESGMDLRLHTNVDKISTIHTQPSTNVDRRNQALREQPVMSSVFTDPLTHDGIGSQTSGTIPNTITLNHSSPRYYNIPQVSRESNGKPLTYMHSQANVSDNISGIIYQNHPSDQPPRREPVDYNRNRDINAVPIYSSDVLVPNHSSSSIPNYPQMSPSLSDAEANYLKQLHSSINPQNPYLTTSPKTDGYHPKLDGSFPPGTTNGASYYPSARLETGTDNKHMNTSSPLNKIVDPQYETRYDRVSISPSTDIHNTAPHCSSSVSEREVPERDTVSQLSLSSQALQDDKIQNPTSEEELIKTQARLQEDEKLKEISTPQKGFIPRIQNYDTAKDETKNSENLAFLRPSASIYDENSNKANNEQMPTSTAPINTTRIEHSLLSNSGPADSVQQEEYLKSREVQIYNEKPSSDALKPVVSISNITSEDVNEYKEEMVPTTDQEETKPRDNQSDHHHSSSKDPPFLQRINESPEKQTSSSKSSPSSVPIQEHHTRSTSNLKPTLNERKYSEESSSSKQSPVSPPRNMGMKNTTRTSATASKATLKNVEDSDTDFFDQNINVTGSAAYRSLVGDKRRGSVTSENDETEREVAGMISKPQTPLLRPSFKSFASSIPSLRPTPPDTDTDSVDSVEAAIQAAMKNKDNETAGAEATADPSKHSDSKSSFLQPEITLENPEIKRPLVQPRIDKATDKKKSNKSAALAINLDSESESYEVSAGGGPSDDDDFDFYDKF